jgi:hypothetical protein
MGISDWLQKKSQEKSASNILDGLRNLVAVVRVHVSEAQGGIDVNDPMRAMARWRRTKAKVIDAQKKLYEDVTVWSSLPPERSFNEVILTELLSGRLVTQSEPCFGPAIVAAYRVCAAAAQQRGVQLEAHAPQEVVQMVRDAGDLYK